MKVAHQYIVSISDLLVRPCHTSRLSTGSSEALAAMMDKNMYVASVVATYWFVSISMVYLNKVLMSNEQMSIPAPIFVTWFQCVCTAIICWVAGKIGERAQAMEAAQYQSVSQSEEVADGQQRSQPKALKPGFFAQFPKAEYRIRLGIAILPLSLVFVGMITFNNFSNLWKFHSTTLQGL